MLDEVKEITRKTMTRCQQNGIRDWASLKNQIRDVVSKNLYDKTKRRPMIIPILQEVK
jgi:ribonuclease J